MCNKQRHLIVSLCYQCSWCFEMVNSLCVTGWITQMIIDNCTTAVDNDRISNFMLLMHTPLDYYYYCFKCQDNQVVSACDLVVGADVQYDRQTLVRRNAAHRSVQSQLANRYSHAEWAEVTQTQYTLTVRHDDRLHTNISTRREVLYTRQDTRSKLLGTAGVSVIPD